MEKDLFANDGSFMEKFKQMQKVMEEKSNTVSTKPPVSSVPPMVPAKPSVVLNKRPLDQKGSIMKKTDQSTGTSSGATGKLAFSLKSKSKVVTAPVGFGMDEEDDEGDNGVSPHEPAKRHKMDQGLGSENGVVGNVFFIVVFLNVSTGISVSLKAVLIFLHLKRLEIHKVVTVFMSYNTMLRKFFFYPILHLSIILVFYIYY